MRSLTICVSAADHDWLVAGAKALHLHVSEFAREMLLLRKEKHLRRLRVPLTAEQERVASQLANVGNNLNQLVVLTRQQGCPVVAAELAKLVQQLSAFLSQLHHD